MSNRPKLTKQSKGNGEASKNSYYTGKVVDSLLDAMEEGNEYGSIVSIMPKEGTDLANEVAKSLADIEKATNRPCIAYLGNIVTAQDHSGIDPSDELPFSEMVNNVATESKELDIVLATNGGSGQQVSRFVNCLRQKFDLVRFIIPSLCMSAGTLFALSGDAIIMTDRGCLGPIDPQVPTKDGRYVPAQALLALVNKIQMEGDNALKSKLNVPWSSVRIIDSIDKKELAEAVTASSYSITMAKEFLENYKFRTWTTHTTTGQPVTPEEKARRALEIAADLASHEKWKSHGHSISREILRKEINLFIEHPDNNLDRLIKRMWALSAWIFDKTPTAKMLISRNYRYIRSNVQQIVEVRK
jgi:hypothetical protein